MSIDGLVRLDLARRDFGLYLNASKPTEFPEILVERLGTGTVQKAVETMTAVVVSAAASVPAAARVEEAVAEVKSAGRGTSPYRA